MTEIPALWNWALDGDRWIGTFRPKSKLEPVIIVEADTSSIRNIGDFVCVFHPMWNGNYGVCRGVNEKYDKHFWFVKRDHINFEKQKLLRMKKETVYATKEEVFP